MSVTSDMIERLGFTGAGRRHWVEHLDKLGSMTCSWRNAAERLVDLLLWKQRRVASARPVDVKVRDALRWSDATWEFFYRLVELEGSADDSGVEQALLWWHSRRLAIDLSPPRMKGRASGRSPALILDEHAFEESRDRDAPVDGTIRPSYDARLTRRGLGSIGFVCLTFPRGT